MSSSKVNGSCFDVFLSFRGQDTRHSFSDHLYDALNRAGISTFRDDEEINKDDELKPEIERAIKESRSSIVVLSKNYATSSWCLDKLHLILDQRRNCNHFTLPVFYHVDPLDVRKQTNTFAIEVQDSSWWTDDNVHRWKAALTEVANLSGMLLYGFDSLFLFVT
ncbi:Toll/interleukin-1 receptor-like protein [Tanacetum coccineum]